MILSTNQKAVKIIKVEGEPFGLINRMAAERAMKSLTGGAFKLWCYLALNQDGYLFGLSNKDVFAKTGISRATYQRAIQELVDKGYLVAVELKVGLSGFLFFEDSESQNDAMIASKVYNK